VTGLERTEKARAASAAQRRRRKLEGMAAVLEAAGYRVIRPGKSNEEEAPEDEQPTG